jgi:hypothetical protein
MIAIDPGASGAIVIQTEGEPIKVVSTPETRGDAITLLRDALEWKSSCVAYIEKINGFIPDGGASQMFEFGKSVERNICILEVLGCPVVEITPQSWQKMLGLGTSERKRAAAGATPKEKAAVKAWNAIAKRDWKNKLKGVAQQRFPEIKVTLKNCDALLILEAARLIEKGITR